jgi:hypothetical protein
MPAVLTSAAQPTSLMQPWLQQGALPDVHQRLCLPRTCGPGSGYHSRQHTWWKSEAAWAPLQAIRCTGMHTGPLCYHAAGPGWLGGWNALGHDQDRNQRQHRCNPNRNLRLSAPLRTPLSSTTACCNANNCPLPRCLLSWNPLKHLQPAALPAPRATHWETKASEIPCNCTRFQAPDPTLPPATQSDWQRVQWCAPAEAASTHCTSSGELKQPAIINQQGRPLQHHSHQELHDMLSRTRCKAPNTHVAAHKRHNPPNLPAAQAGTT